MKRTKHQLTQVEKYKLVKWIEHELGEEEVHKCSRELIAMRAQQALGFMVTSWNAQGALDVLGWVAHAEHIRQQNRLKRGHTGPVQPNQMGSKAYQRLMALEEKTVDLIASVELLSEQITALVSRLDREDATPN